MLVEARLTGSRVENFPPCARTESGRTPAVPDVSTSRESACMIHSQEAAERMVVRDSAMIAVNHAKDRLARRPSATVTS